MEFEELDAIPIMEVKCENCNVTFKELICRLFTWKRKLCPVCRGRAAG